MSKIVIGAVTAALWFALSYTAHAERVCRQVCGRGACISKCVDHPFPGVVVYEPKLTATEERTMDVTVGQ